MGCSAAREEAVDFGGLREPTSSDSRQHLSRPVTPAGARPEHRRRLAQSDRVVDAQPAPSASEANSQNFGDRYEVSVEIGSGSFATVYAAKRVEDNQNVAIKVLARRPEDNVDDWTAKAFRERDIWRKLSQSSEEERANLLCLEDFHAIDDVCAYVSERADCSLWMYLRARCSITESTVAPLLQGMLSGIACVHGCGIIHRDIKNSNFMMLRGVVKLIDFGLSLDTNVAALSDYGSAGTAPFMSPEMVRKERYDTKTDIWSLGVIAYNLLCGRFPYMPQELSPRYMKTAIREDFPVIPFETPGNDEPLSAEATSFLRSVLDRDQTNRPTAADLSNHRFVVRGSSSAASLRQRLLDSYHVGAFT